MMTLPGSKRKNIDEAGQDSQQPEVRIGSKRLAASSNNPSEQDWLLKLHEKIINVLDLSLVTSLPEREARAHIRDTALGLLNDDSAPLTASARQKLATQLENEILGIGPLEPLMEDPSVADILVNGYDSVYVERYGKLEPTDVKFRSNSHLMNIIDRIVSIVGRRIDESSPMCDARLQDGSRVNVIIPPLALDGPILSIRRFAVERLGVDSLVENGSLTPSIAEVLHGIVKSRLNVLISGGTGSGKTTLLNIVSGFIPHNERIVTIEDSAELQLQQPHVARLETRPPNVEQKGEVTQRDLVRNSLRMRPDRIVVGEVRGAEALDMLQAMNTGHDGSLTTIHANTPRDALSRVETMVTMAGLNLPVHATRSQIASAINVVVQLERMEDGKRRMVSLQEVQGMEGEVITMSEIFKYQRRGLDEDGNVIGQFESTGVVPKFNEHLRQRGIQLDLKLFRPNTGL